MNSVVVLYSLLYREAGSVVDLPAGHPVRCQISNPPLRLIIYGVLNISFGLSEIAANIAFFFQKHSTPTLPPLFLSLLPYYFIPPPPCTRIFYPLQTLVTLA